MAPGVKKGSAVAAPDGGWGWMIVAGCFITTICTRAVTRCVSMFFLEFHMHFSSEYSRTAWIHSLVDCTTMLCAPLGSYIGNRLSCRVAVMVGGLLSSLGLILSSFASSLEYLYLSLGILTGVGFALCYTPAVAMVGTYFSERKALAYGIAMSGSGIGTFILAPVVQLLVELYSWRGALLILGGFVSHLCVCGALMRPLGRRHRRKQYGKDQEEELSMLNAKIAGAKLHMELNLEEAKNLEMVFSGVNEEEEQTQCLLKNEERGDLTETTNPNRADRWSVASNQEDSAVEEKRCGEHAEEDMMENPMDTELNSGDTIVISMNKLSKDLQPNTNSKSTNSKDPPASGRKSKLDPNLSNTVLTDSKQADSEPTGSRLSDSMLVHSVLTDLLQAQLKLNDSTQPEIMLSDSALKDFMQANLELTGSKLPDSMLVHSVLTDPMQADSESAGLKLPESMLIDSAITDPMRGDSELSGLKLPDSMVVHSALTEPMPAGSESTALKLPESMLINYVLTDPMQSDSEQIGLKLTESKLIHSALTDPIQANLELTGSKLPDSMLVHSVLTDPMQADSESAGLKLPESMLIDSAITDPMRGDSELSGLKLPDSMVVHSAITDPMRGDSELTSLKLPESMLIDSALTDPMRGDSELSGLKLPDPKLVYSALNESLPAESKLCEVVPCERPGFPVEKDAPGGEGKGGCWFLPSTEEYSFLLIPDFLLLSVSFLFLAFGCSVPFVYLVPYSLSIGVSHQQAALLMSVLGVMGIVGNITFGWISDRRCLRSYRVVSYLLAVGLEGLSCLFVPLLWNFSLLVPFSLFYGYFDGAYVALLPVVTSDTVGPTYLSSALGVVCFLHAIPYLTSPPIAGWLVDQTGSYTAAFLLCGFSLICSALILAVVTLARRCSRGSSHSY